jgi:hypothetical protein
MAREPSLPEVLTAAIDARLLDLHTCLPGRVQGYNPATQTADVVPVVKRAVATSDGSTKHEDLPVIHNVPVVFPRGGGCSIQFPLSAGDHVWLMFSEAAMAHWRSTGQISAPGDLRRHDLSYPVALPGIGPMTQPLTPIVGNEMVLDGAAIRLGGLTADYVALSTLVAAELLRIKTDLDTLKVATSAGLAASLPGNGAATAGTFNTATAAVPSAPGSVAASKVKAQ